MQIAEMIDGPIQMVTFDLYDTLVEADPPGWERFRRAVTAAIPDASITLEDSLRAYAAGQRFFTVENGTLPIRDRDAKAKREFRRDITMVSMIELDLPTDSHLVEDVMNHVQSGVANDGGYSYRPFEEVPEVMRYLAKHKVKCGVISNADDDVTRFCLHMGFAEHMDIIVTSALVGWEKPDARTFYAALEPFNLPASAVLHVGDQPGSDVLGARAVGMAAALLDRYDQYPHDPEDALRVTSLMQLAELVTEYNDSFE